jgi:hypothetical protein
LLGGECERRDIALFGREAGGSAEKSKTHLFAMAVRSALNFNTSLLR